MSSSMMNNTSDIFEETHEEGEDMVELTAEEVLRQLQDAWVNERNAPDLLEPKMEIVECMLEQVAVMEQNLETLQKGDLRIFVHKMEISRIKYLINSYLRTRMDKIQNNFLYYIKNRTPDNPNRLSAQESTFLDDYTECVGDLFSSLCLDHLPVTSDWTNKKVPQPNLQTAVFVKCMENVHGLEIRDPSNRGRDDTIDLASGDSYMLQYSNIAHLIDGGSVKLE